MIRLSVNFMTLLALLYLTSGCNGPLGPIPGSKLSGTVSDKAIQDWSFAADIDVIQLETRPKDPHSVNTWVGVHEGKLYIPTSLIRGDAEPNNRDWVKHVMMDPKVRLRINGTIYPATASRVIDQALVDTVRKQLLLKYAEEPTEHSSAAWLFMLESRSS
ncbi:MAG: hypothetical protein NXH95_11730 [Pseudomonadaceae bacterium]|nr:hypothetical protein [Pseudomonadaceae bacterium]